MTARLQRVSGGAGKAAGRGRSLSPPAETENVASVVAGRWNRRSYEGRITRVASMPVPRSGDPEETRRRLRDWLAEKQPNTSRVEILSLDMPRTNGFSSETLMFEAAWTRNARREERKLVARVAPTGYSIFPEYDLERQRRVIEALG